MSILLPLELWLKEKPEGPEYPDPRLDYFERYKDVKEWMIKNIYSKIEKINAAKEGGYYTDHGLPHVEDLISYASKLIKVDILQKKCSLSHYEVFLLLMSALLHDAGMYYGRDGHETSVKKVIRKLGPIFQGDAFEADIVSKICGAHSGKKDGKPYDKIANLDMLSGMYLQIQYRPKLLAGIIRLADEISETKLRADVDALNDCLITSFQSLVCNKYASYITNSLIDHEAQAIKLEFHIPLTDVMNCTKIDDKEIYMIDEVCSRLEKMNCERIYCCRYISSIIYITKIFAKIIVYKIDEVNDGLHVAYTKEISIGDNGYPDGNFKLAHQYPDLNGAEFKITVSNAGC